MATDPFHEYTGPETPASDLFDWTADERFQLGRISRWDNSFEQPLGWYVGDRRGGAPRRRRSAQPLRCRPGMGSLPKLIERRERLGSVGRLVCVSFSMPSPRRSSWRRYSELRAI